MNVIIYKDLDGNLNIIQPIDSDIERVIKKSVPTYRFYQNTQENETDKQAKARIGVSDLDKKLPYEVVPATSVLYDKTFRNAWDMDNKNIVVNMDKARAIQLSRIRKARDAALQKLDIEQLKGNDVQADKQKLRDIPESFDLTTASNPDELKALWPAELKDFKA